MSELMPSPVVRSEGVNFAYGEGEARNPVLFDMGLAVMPGQLVVMTGPSGSGKTTLLTLVGALRSLQDGRIEVLGHDLSGLGRSDLVRVRRDIGFIFQMHNLFESLSAYENVKMALQLTGRRSAADARARGVEMLERLGLRARRDHKPPPLAGPAPASTPSRARCRAGSANGWRSPGRWSTGRASSSPTSRPRRSTPTRPATSFVSSRS